MSMVVSLQLGLLSALALSLQTQEPGIEGSNKTLPRGRTEQVESPVLGE